MKDIKKFVMNAPKDIIWEEVHKKIVGTDLDYKAVKSWVMMWLERRDRREVFYKSLISILKR